tara:strand:- start:939 stop:1304 length:366 start_codon:yes stop_codon:yes gene_type:complete
MATDDTIFDDDESVEEFQAALIEFIQDEGLRKFREKLAEKFRTDAPSRSGKSKKTIRENMDEGVLLPMSLVYTSEGTTRKGVFKPGTGFIDEVLDADLELWLEIIEEWANSQSSVDTIVID